MAEQGGNTSTGSGTSAIAWAMAGTGVGMALSRWWFTGERWLVPSGAVLIIGGITLAFYGYVQRGGLESPSRATSTSFLAPLAGLLAASLVVAIAAAHHGRVGVGVGAGIDARAPARDLAALRVPGLELSLPPTRQLAKNLRLARVTAELIGPPAGRLSVDWRESPVEADAATLRRAAESLSSTWGALQRSYDYAGPSTRGALFAYRKNKRHTAIALVRCIDHPLSMSIAVTTAVESDAVASARAIADAAKCTGEAATRASADVWPDLALGERFGLIQLNEAARMFASLDGEALVFHRHGIDAIKTLQREPRALQMSLSGGASIENWTAARWPIGHNTRQPLWSFDMVENSGSAEEVRKQAFATTLICQEPGVGFVVLGVGTDRGANLARLLSVSCPRRGEPAPAYQTIEQVTRKLCDRGDSTACEALAKAP